MTKYVIAKAYNREVWCAYRVFFGLWGDITYVGNTASVISAVDCEEKLIRRLNWDKKLKIKEIEY
jgi:hypothetical protein